jgi:uncharacterized protein
LYAAWDSDATVVKDDRFDYGETRWIALGRVGGEPRALVFTLRGTRMRLICYRRAHEEELRRHEQ